MKAGTPHGPPHGKWEITQIKVSYHLARHHKRRQRPLLPMDMATLSLPNSHTSKVASLTTGPGAQRPLCCVQGSRGHSGLACTCVQEPHPGCGPKTQVIPGSTNVTAQTQQIQMGPWPQHGDGLTAAPAAAVFPGANLTLPLLVTRPRLHVQKSAHTSSRSIVPVCPEDCPTMPAFLRAPGSSVPRRPAATRILQLQGWNQRPSCRTDRAVHPDDTGRGARALTGTSPVLPGASSAEGFDPERQLQQGHTVWLTQGGVRPCRDAASSVYAQGGTFPASLEDEDEDRGLQQGDPCHPNTFHLRLQDALQTEDQRSHRALGRAFIAEEEEHTGPNSGDGKSL
ncbi:hypothetical protein CB1_000274016 [Camelus ferus]|nr:hypothetical protein CB1_000274016 [Camelus ferus]